MVLSRAYYILGVVTLLQLVPAWASAEYRYRLYLDGKPGSTELCLSDRAKERRMRQGIEYDSTDLDVSPEYLAALHDKGWRVLTQSRWLNTVVVMRPDGGAIDEAELRSLPFVKSSFTVTLMQQCNTQRMQRCNKFAIPATDPATETLDAPASDPASAPKNASESPARAGVIPVSDNCTTPLKQLNAYTTLYEAGHRGQGQLIVVLDAGFVKVDKWDWLGSRVVGTRDLLVSNQADSKVYTADSHGTCCLSIMVSPREKGVCGTAQDADYYLIRTEAVDSETPFEEDLWVAGAELADSIGADVISSSLGYYEYDYGLPSHTQDEFAQGMAFISCGAEIACQKGMLVVNAAGNEGNSQWQRLLFPADAESVLTVGGVNKEGGVTSFSSRGFTTPYVKPDVMARASQCYTVNVNTNNGAAVSTGAGTSYATPLVAGLCASLWSAVPELTPAQLREVLRQSASYYTQPDSIHGYGVPDFGVALSLAQQWVGQGIETINADSTDDGTGTEYYYSLQGHLLPRRPDGGFYLRRRSSFHTGKSFQQR